MTRRHRIPRRQHGGTGDGLVHAGWCEATWAIPTVKARTHDKVIAAAGNRPRGPVQWLISTSPTEALELLAAIDYPADGTIRTLLDQHGGYVVIAMVELLHHHPGDAT